MLLLMFVYVCILLRVRRKGKLELHGAGDQPTLRVDFRDPLATPNVATPDVPTSNASALAKRMSEKCPNGGIGRRSTRTMSVFLCNHVSYRCQEKSDRQPNLHAAGENQRSKVRRMPALRPPRRAHTT